MSYAQWDSTWVERVEDAQSTRRKRNLQYKDKQLFNVNIDTTDSLPDNNITDPSLQEASQRRPSCPSIDMLVLLEQQQINLKEEFSRMLEENQRRIEHSQFLIRREFNDKIEDLKQIVVLEMKKLNRHFDSEFSLSSDND